MSAPTAEVAGGPAEARAAVEAHLTRHRIVGGGFLGLDPACLAAIDVPEAARLAGLRTWGWISVGAGTLSGACLAWLSGLGWMAPLLGAGFGLFVWNLLRLGAAGGAPTHRGEAAVAAWRPGRGAVGVLAVLGALLGQPVVAVVAGMSDPAGLAEARAGVLAGFRVDPGDPTEAAWVEGVAARLAESPMFAASVHLGWTGPIGPAVTLLFAGLVAAPAIGRRAAPRALGQYERVRVRRERARIERAWRRSEARVVALLAPWGSFPGQLRALSTDPPFDDRPLLLGFAHGTRGPADLAALRAHVPGYDAACTPGGRARETTRRALDAAIATAAEPLLRATHLVARAELVDPVDPDVARADAAAALTVLAGVTGREATCLRVRAALVGDDRATAELAVEALVAMDPDGAETRRLAGRVRALAPAETPEARLQRARAVRELVAGTPDEAAAGRAVARCLLPRGGAEASRLAEEGLRAAKAAGDPRALAAALDLIAALDPTRAPASRREAVRLLTRVWSDDPTPVNTRDLATVLYAAARSWTDPHAAKLEMARARALAAEALARRPDPRAAAVLAAIEGLDPAPLLDG